MVTTTCLFFDKAYCWKTNFTSSGLWVSGECTACLLALNYGAHTNNKIRVLHVNGQLLSGSIPQVSGYM